MHLLDVPVFNTLYHTLYDVISCMITGSKDTHFYFWLRPKPHDNTQYYTRYEVISYMSVESKGLPPNFDRYLNRTFKRNYYHHLFHHHPQYFPLVWNHHMNSSHEYYTNCLINAYLENYIKHIIRYWPV